MPLPPGHHELGPQNATLTVRTARQGAASKAGHDLVIEVTAWSGVLEVGEGISMSLTADASSLRVREGTGGVTRLGDEEKAGIEQSIRDEVLRGTAIEFRSTGVSAGADGALSVEGELELAGQSHPIGFVLSARGGLRGRATVTQSQWGMKPFSILFGTLKVADEVEVEIDAHPS